LLRGDGESDVFEFLPAMLARFAREGSVWNLNWTIVP
jgi:hypothetical protein